jgi:transposase
MPAPMSLDLRRRIVRTVERGSSSRAAARRFALSPSAAIELMQRVRTTGSADFRRRPLVKSRRVIIVVPAPRGRCRAVVPAPQLG